MVSGRILKEEVSKVGNHSYCVSRQSRNETEVVVEEQSSIQKSWHFLVDTDVLGPTPFLAHRMDQHRCRL